ncbi:uncharacterized protein B0I36DRAFT_406662 [Microdochium trichocladiopsis]|uniref:Rhodopsin domain-containing protein n=1 Tax=Microdochium trichocladiopsis TaxID=1682393 RepID=A0A9P8YF87_9PEZI|nr:uncharacterized protein B0I36DRAFT_406662 [Microdochium trichocladiopsis]KAH7035922.1 hypothetical protein B0I36DRAFT_406662 [Microdochium trichocladiopsis]
MARITTSLLLAARNEEGEYIAKASHEIARIPPQGFGLAIQITVYVLAVLCTILICLRVYARSFLVGRNLMQMGWDDYLAIAGYIPFIPSGVFAIIGVQYGLGAWDWQIPEGQLELYQARTKENMVYFELIYFGASLMTKLSMALMILRLSTEKKYSYIIWGSLAMMGAIAVGCLGVMFGNCQPFQATWNEKLGHCHWPNSQGWVNLSYFGAAGLAAVDWTCAITPFFILQGLQMPPRRKISVQIILGLGLIGSVAGVVRIPFFAYYDTEKYPDNTLYFFGHTIIWTIYEAGLGIMACSLPPLRALFSKFYHGSSGPISKNPGDGAGRMGVSAFPIFSYLLLSPAGPAIRARTASPTNVFPTTSRAPT